MKPAMKGRGHVTSLTYANRFQRGCGVVYNGDEPTNGLVVDVLFANIAFTCEIVPPHAVFEFDGEL